MRLLFSFAVALICFAWMACGHGKPYDESANSESRSPVNQTLQPQNLSPGPDGNSLPAIPTTTIPTATTTAGLNPAHGQPGHRCDIAVGAPLNSAPSIQTTPVQQNIPGASTPVNISTSQPAQSLTTAAAPGMNPAHGQPGHRCDIAVGAPLDSKPTTTPPVATTPVSNTKDKISQPVSTTTVAPGMNPAHGQPGHRCDIAVGAPLDSKPITVAGIPSTNTVTGTSSIPAVIPVKALPDSAKQKP